MKQMMKQVLLACAVGAMCPGGADYASAAGHEVVKGKAVQQAQPPGKQIIQPKLNSYNIPERYRARTVAFSGYDAGTIVVDPENYFLYYVEGRGKARRYGIAVGKIGLQFKGTATVNNKREWPRWIPTREMVQRDPAHYGRFANGMDGGPGNPLGSRALYLFQGNKDTYIRIHGTVQPWTIGSPASNGCFRMTNDDILDLYERVKIGAKVVVL
ncbi:MAG: ErfK/YbiS/YcfS/YnhG family protein [Candidatus Tokpelaia hoelldobleri]|uniref:ErfK/YbiS/YcfS/YnhG family protein n=1 Tax=Candidatus Tokpelaia hoelldobleri TaxID=1902579 RepID=A0A1U9JU12_9HYPH|nr:MAG: ErfK/YbiS/YcfS/YnhG family protein [Candidatus Tokpelaia hoelldoblerii]